MFPYREEKLPSECAPWQPSRTSVPQQPDSMHERVSFGRLESGHPQQEQRLQRQMRQTSWQSRWLTVAKPRLLITKLELYSLKKNATAYSAGKKKGSELASKIRCPAMLASESIHLSSHKSEASSENPKFHIPLKSEKEIGLENAASNKAATNSTVRAAT